MNRQAVLLAQRLAERYRAEGFRYPSVAAAAVACRGLAGLETDSFARHAGITESDVEAFEGGYRTASDLVGAYSRVAPAEILDLLRRECSPSEG
jgi:hypothetical protein